MSNLEDLKKQEKAIREEVWALEQIESEKRNAALVGRCFRYRNSYSCPEPWEKWWLYVKVTGVRGNYLETFRFQDDLQGHIEIESQSWSSPNLVGEEITLEEFQAEWQNLLTKMNDGAIASTLLADRDANQKRKDKKRA